MNKLQIYLEELQLPIKSLFLATFLIAVGSILGNPFLNEILKLDYPIVITITNILLFTGGLIVKAFPFLVFVKLLQARMDEKNIVVVGIISYLVYLIMILFFAPGTLPENAYSTLLSFNINLSELKMMHTGTIGLFGIYAIVRRVYKKPMHARNSNFTKLLDRDSIRLMQAVLASVIFGIAMAYFFPNVIDWLYISLKFVASDFTNPMSQFAYSSVERLTTLLGLDSIVRNEMWFTSMGGTWNSLDNLTYIGDVNIWAAQLKDSVAVIGVGSAGRFSTYYYVLNIFAIPAYIIAVSTTVTDTKKKSKAIVTVLLGTVISIVSGIVFPIEIIMILTTPILYIFHLFMVGFISAVLLGLSITLGFSYLGILSAANPGNLLDIISISRKNIVNQQVLILLLFGVIVFFIYYYVTRIYYSKVAIDILNIGIKDDEVTDFIERVGGIDNIIKISSYPTRITVQLKDEDNINTGGLHYQGVTKIILTREGYSISYGAGSYMLQKEVNERIKKNNILKEE